MNPSLRTTVVGSFPVPDWLKACPLEQARVDAIAIALRCQEAAGVDVVSDGEISRWDLPRGAPGGMVERFACRMGGVSPELSCAQRLAFRRRPEMAYRPEPPGVVTGELSAGRLDLVKDWELAQRLTNKPLKFTVTSPYMLARVVQDDHYGDLEKLALAFAEVLAAQVAEIGAAVVQVDEPHLPGSAADGPLAARAINRLLAAVKGQKAVHVCFGNFGGQTIQRGHYAKLIEFMNRLDCDHLVLETTRRTAGEIERLADVRPEIQLGLGVIDVKDLQVESPETVARRIESLARRLGVRRIAWVHPDCGLQHLPRVVAERKLDSLVRGRDLFAGLNTASA